MSVEFENEMKDFKNEMLEFKDEMTDFKNEMLDFKDEMKDFKNEMLEFKNIVLFGMKELNTKVDSHTKMLEDINYKIDHVVKSNLTAIIKQQREEIKERKVIDEKIRQFETKSEFKNAIL